MVSIALLLSGDTGNKIINFQDYNAQTIGIILLWLSAALLFLQVMNICVKELIMQFLKIIKIKLLFSFLLKFDNFHLNLLSFHKL